MKDDIKLCHNYKTDIDVAIDLYNKSNDKNCSVIYLKIPNVFYNGVFIGTLFYKITSKTKLQISELIYIFLTQKKPTTKIYFNTIKTIFNNKSNEYEYLIRNYITEKEIINMNAQEARAKSQATKEAKKQTIEQQMESKVQEILHMIDDATQQEDIYSINVDVQDLDKDAIQVLINKFKEMGYNLFLKHDFKSDKTKSAILTISWKDEPVERKNLNQLFNHFNDFNDFDIWADVLKKRAYTPFDDRFYL